MGTVHLKKAKIEDQALIESFDEKLYQGETIKIARTRKIAKAIVNEECFIILTEHNPVGFIFFNYNFFDLGWIELIMIEEEYRGRGFAGQAIGLICELSKTQKVFTSTNLSNIQMQSVLNKTGFTFAGPVDGLDEGDPELFYYKVTTNGET
jgi:RimJ/RimL family protein N-acetyltransferase